MPTGTRSPNQLDTAGISPTGPLLESDDCRELAALYDQSAVFRSTIDMARHRFGEGQYRYFAHPLAARRSAELRAAVLAAPPHVARDWATRLRQAAPWPDDLDEWIDQCHAAGQTRPTPLMLRYGPGDWNALHRDLYGDLVFPLQVVIGLDVPGEDYTGGEFVVVEQRPPRWQSRAPRTRSPRHGIVFTTRERPIVRRADARPRRCGTASARCTPATAAHPGLIFHDAA